MADTAAITAAVTRIIQEVTGIDAETITPEMTLSGDLGVDSLGLVDIAVRCGQSFHLPLDDSVLAGLVTVADVVSFVETTQPAAAE